MGQAHPRFLTGVKKPEEKEGDRLSRKKEMKNSCRDSFNGCFTASKCGMVDRNNRERTGASSAKDRWKSRERGKFFLLEPEC